MYQKMMAKMAMMAKKLVGYAFVTLASNVRTTGVRCMDASVLFL
jgi:hypothetical protein